MCLTEVTWLVTCLGLCLLECLYPIQQQQAPQSGVRTKLWHLSSSSSSTPNYFHQISSSAQFIRLRAWWLLILGH